MAPIVTSLASGVHRRPPILQELPRGTTGESASPTAGWVAPFITKTAESPGSIISLNDIAVDVSGSSVALDTSGAIYATGSFGAEGFTPGSGLPTVANGDGTDIYLSKFTISGTLARALTFGGTGGAQCYGLSVDASGMLILVGSSYPGTVDFDPDPLKTRERTNTAYGDMFLLKLVQS